MSDDHVPEKQVQTYIPIPLLEQIDARAKSVRLSRRRWIVKALAWAVSQPIRTTRTEEQL